MLSLEKQVELLVGLGFMPAAAEAIVRDDQEAKHEIISTRASDRHAKITNIEAQIAAAWWYYSPEVPTQTKRMLDAKQTE